MKHLFRIVGLICVATILLSALSVKKVEAKVSLSSGACASCRSLSAVAAVSATDIWAVGSQATSHQETLTEHWNGSQWTVVKSPNVGSMDNSLSGVAVVSANDVWAVGNYSNIYYPLGTLIEHWNGSQWSIVKSPTSKTNYSYLDGVAVVSATDIWAVGGDNNNTLTEHWNGSQWKVIASPNPGPNYNDLYNVTAISANNVWAVGDYYDSNNHIHTLTEQWNGSQWNVISSPSPGLNYDDLYSVAAISASDVWTVGFYDNSNNHVQTLTEHWNGSQWGIVKSPNPNSNYNYLNSVRLASATDIWGVGYYINNKNFHRTLTEHWNGSQWTIVKSPNTGSMDNSLNGLAVVATNDVWAVGEDSINGTLIEHWNGSQWSVITGPSYG